MELLTDDIPEFLSPLQTATAYAPPLEPAAPPTIESQPTDLTTLQGLITVEVAAQFQAQPKPPAMASNEGRIMATTPQGFTVTLVTRKDTPGEVMTALASMQDWLIASGYQPL